MTDPKFKVFVFKDTAYWPHHGSDGAAGYDLYAPQDAFVLPGEQTLIKTGVGFEIPSGWYGQIQGRSSLNKRSIVCMPGVIDSDYRGDVAVGLFNMGNDILVIKRGDRIAQIIFVACWNGSIEMTTLDKVQETDRGAAGFGSTGT